MHHPKPDIPMASLLHCLLLLLSFSTAFSSPSGFTSFSKTPSTTKTTTTSTTTNNNNPFNAKASAIRYWNRKVPNNQPHPPFLLSKLSPLSPLQLSTYSSLPLSALASNLPSFCSSANLLCTPNTTFTSLSSSKPADFKGYTNSNFTNYATKAVAFTNSFTNYSDDVNSATDTFRRYSRDSVGDTDTFSTYSPNGNVVATNFKSYSTGQTGGTGDFTGYHEAVNVPDLNFLNYDTEANGPDRTFKQYTGGLSNHGDENFASYAKSSNGVNTEFVSYSNESNVITSGFKHYAEDGNGASNKFSSYGENGNVPEVGFNNYGDNGNGGVDDFVKYRDQSNVGDDSFTTYGKNANDEQVGFKGYGMSFNQGSDNFNKYGEGSFDDNMTFTTYAGDLTNFKRYYNAKAGNTFTFKSYINNSVVPLDNGKEVTELNEKKLSGKITNKFLVEPGKFFRESSMKKGTVMPMPDIRDKMIPRSFLPRAISSKIPLSVGNVTELFNIPVESALGKSVVGTVSDCMRKPAKGETKRCATSAEDMIDFAVSVLGSNVVVRTTENTKGSKGEVLIGNVRGINGGKVTQSVSCHQSLFPYLVYYCHSVPKVRVYEADILAVDTKEKINHGVAICHLDTSDWSAGHGAFIALGSQPGKIEVCHWIFEGDMTWAVAD